MRKTALTAAALALSLAAVASGAEQPWSERFPEIAGRVRHFDERMGSADENARFKVMRKLMYDEHRDSEHFPPFLRAALKDPSPNIRWYAAHHLQQHHIFLSEQELPESFLVPFAGLVKPGDPGSIERTRRMAGGGNMGAGAGWAIKVLGLVKDQEARPLAKKLLESENVFTRFSAAMALLELGEECEDKQAAIAELKAITKDKSDTSNFYRMRASEVLIRLGYREYFRTLIDAVNKREGYGDSGINVLADLTGEYFATAAEWRVWWQGRQDKVPEMVAPPPAPAAEPATEEVF